MGRRMTKPTRSPVRPALTQISLGCAPSEDSDQPGHPPSLSRAFAVRSVGSQGPNVSSYGQRRLRSACAADLRWPHMSFCWFCHEAAQMLFFFCFCFCCCCFVLFFVVVVFCLFFVCFFFVFVCCCFFCVVVFNKK